jgi:hypothetical protein
MINIHDDGTSSMKISARRHRGKPNDTDKNAMVTMMIDKEAQSGCQQQH